MDGTLACSTVCTFVEQMLHAHIELITPWAGLPYELLALLCVAYARCVCNAATHAHLAFIVYHLCACLVHALRVVCNRLVKHPMAWLCAACCALVMRGMLKRTLAARGLRVMCISNAVTRLERRG